MDDRAAAAGDRVDRLRVELRLLPILGLVRALVRPAQTEIQRQAGPGPKLVLNVEAVGPPARQPGGQIARELGALDGAEQEGGEAVSGVRAEGKVGAPML